MRPDQAGDRARKRTDLTAEKRALLMRRLQQRRAETSIPRRPVDRPAPLSHTQERMWLLDQIEPEGCAYNVVVGLSLIGPLDPTALLEALTALVTRHEILRTTFQVVDEQPRQISGDPYTPPIERQDLSDLGPDDQEAAIREIARSHGRRPFDLSRGPLVTGLLLCLGPHRHALLLRTHHIAFDGWSHQVLIQDLAALYGVARGETASAPRQPALQYADFACWQRSDQCASAPASQIDYWKAQLAGMTLLELPCDRPDGTRWTYWSALHRCSVTLGQTALKRLAQEENTTPFTVLLTAYLILLHRYTGADDVCVGVPVAGRSHVELEPLIGAFINTVAIRSGIEAHRTVRQQLRCVNDAVTAALANQDTPFEEVVHALGLPRDHSRPQVFQTMFQLRNFPRSEALAGGLTFEEYPVDSGVSPIELALELAENLDGYALAIRYHTDRYSAAQVARLATHYQVVLRGMLDDPDAAMAHLPLLTPEEHRRVIVEWNRTSVAHPRDRCLHHLVEEQARRHPDAIALHHRERTLSYRTLDADANRLAHWLRAQRVGPDCLVGLLVERSIEMIVAMVAIHKAGGAYLPLDPAYPTERLRFMLDDAAAVALLYHTATRDRLPHRDVPMLSLDADWDSSVAELPAHAPDAPVGPEHLAYAIYTSGSTGTPKGVLVEHGSAVNFVLAAIGHQGLSADERLLQLSTMAFDASVEEIQCALGCGATLVLYPDRDIDANRLLDCCADYAVTSLYMTQSLWSLLTDEAVRSGQRAPQCLRRCVLGGEALRGSDLRLWLEHVGPHVTVFNTYGPTEITVYATQWHSRTPPDTTAPPPIGRPIDNTRCYVLDRQRNPLPIGLAGELYIGGAGVARGYLNRPELTAERFLDDPFSEEPAARMYRTGDRVRWRADGEIEFLGRIDEQFKIRGYRVEPGEVEAALLQHPGICGAAVVGRNGQLLAYVVPGEQPGPGADELRRYLAQSLPPYLVPSLFVPIAALPMTPSGKVDRRALPDPDRSTRKTDSEFAAPRSATERALADIWAEILGIGQVGIHDDFFALGGHSLLATQMLSRIRSRLGVDLPFRSLFEHPNVAGLAKVVDAALSEPCPAGAVTDRPIPRRSRSGDAAQTAPQR